MKNHMSLIIAVAVAAAMLWCAAGSEAAVWYVDGSVAVSGSGTSWASPLKTIQEAVTKASSLWVICSAPTDQIWVREGIYPLSAPITVNKVVAIYGGFDGTETSVSQRDWENNVTTISGQLSVRCMTITSLCEINGFTFQYGRNSSGAAIYLDNLATESCPPSGTMPTQIRNCTFYYNSAGTSYPGGAIYDLRSSPLISNCTFQSNTAERGGAIFTWQSSPIIERCVFQNNHSLSSGSWGGGAICGDYLVYGSITNCLFASNYSHSWGGALAYHMGYPTVTNCTFADNEAALGGDAVHTNTAKPIFKNCIFWDKSTNEFHHSAGTSTPTVTYSNIRGGYSGSGNISVNPQFVAWNDFQLQHGSPCIDTGTNTGAPNIDLLGVTRPLDGNDSGTAVTDMGAYEHAWVDLMVWGWSTTPTNPVAGEPFNINITIYNAGVVPIEKYFWVDWYAHRTSPPGVSEYGDKYATITNLNPKSYSYITLTHTYATAGTYQSYVMVDTANRIPEVQEGNNLSGPRSITVVPRATLTVNVYLQGSCRPSSGWAFPLQVALFSPGADVLNDTPVATYTRTTSRFVFVAQTSISDVLPGTYDITVGTTRSLLNVRRNVVVSSPSTSVTMGTLLEGNGLYDNAIDLGDLAVLASAWATSKGHPDYNGQADFDRSTKIDMCDYSLLAENWGRTSPVTVP